jgi:hypothetical protein
LSLKPKAEAAMQMSAFSVSFAHVRASVCRFAISRNGAVTVDWVVVTAASVALALAVFGAVRTGTTDLGGAINAAMVDTLVVSAREPEG